MKTMFKLALCALVVFAGQVIASEEAGHGNEHDNDLDEAGIPASVYGFTIMATLILSLLSLSGVLLLLGGIKIDKYLLHLVGLSVGTLLGATFFLLIPETDERIGKGLAGSGSMLAGVMAAMILEIALSSRKKHRHSQGNFSSPVIAGKEGNAPAEPVNLTTVSVEGPKAPAEASSPNYESIQEGETVTKKVPDSSDEENQAITRDRTESESRETSSEESREDLTTGFIRKKGISLREAPTFVWVNLIGDALHNFVDGVLIGATFATGPAEGVATTLAIGAHELPQEIADFGILLHAGLSVKIALLVNVLVGSLAILGAVFALVIGQTFVGSADYMLPFAAGVFLYLALTDLMPEVLHIKLRKQKAGVCAMIAIGMGLMALVRLLPHDHGQGV